MKNIINKIKNLTLGQINRNLILIALLALIYRKGNFYNTYIPKPFEILLVFSLLLTFLDLLINKKLKEFFLSIDRKIWIALSCLVFSVLLGWFVAVFVKNVPINLNVILEFGSFVISIVIFVLVLFYTKNDQIYAKKYFYALLAPTFYIIFILFHGMSNYFNFNLNSHFLGFTGNPNMISKILLIPALFFITNALFELRNKWLKVGYIFISSALVALLFWVASRGGLVSLIISSIFIWLVFSFHNFNWKKLFSNGIIIFFIFLIGFSMVPYSRKQAVVNRALNTIVGQSVFFSEKDKSKDIVIGKPNKDQFVEPRLSIWPFYLRYVLVNPLGIGPNTHMNFGLTDSNGEYLNLGPHNTYIQIWLWGGLLGLLSFLYILFSAFKNLKIKLQSNFNSTVAALVGILFALSIAIMFDDSLSSYWFFIVLALSLKNTITN